MESAADLLNMQVRSVRPPWFLAFRHVKKASTLVVITIEFFLKGFSMKIGFISVAGLAQSVERLTAEREVAGSIPGAGPLLRVLKWLRNEGNSFALQAARPSRGSENHVKWGSRLH